ncbi:MAG TPA: hypothetical protein VHO06_26160 [Polyangia bacterium]|nr:hypothetical protein [Polyangia bacterium]
MVDQLFDSLRRASESSLQMQQEMLKYWAQHWSSVPAATGVSGDAARGVQKRWLALGVELLDKHRASLDSTYAAGIQLIEQAFRATEARSAEDYRKLTEELWRKLFDTYKAQSEAQLEAFQQWAAKSTEAARDVRA